MNNRKQKKKSMRVKGWRKETTGTISLGNEADKKKKKENSGERGAINQMCFCIIGTLVFCFFMKLFKNDKDAHKHGPR